MLKSNSVKAVLIFALCALIIIISAFAFNRKGAVADSDDSPAYAYAHSSIIIDVNENKVLHVKENLKVGFLRRVSGMTRRIPAKTASYKNQNGKAVKKSSFLAKLENISATVNGAAAQTSYNKNGTDYYLSIDNPEGRFVVWEKGFDDRQYEITLEYDFNLTDDGAGNNALVFNVFDEVDARWFYYGDDQNNVAMLSVTVNMPKAFDSGLAAVYFDQTDVSADTDLKSEGNSVGFSIPFGEANKYSLRLLLDDGYFTTHVTYYSFYWYYAGAVGAIILICLVLTLLYLPKKPVCPVETEPPVINPMHYSAYWHGYPHRRDVSTIILHWARLGCVKISKDGKRDLVLTKLKPLPPDRSGAENRYFNCLFKAGDKFYSKQTRGFQNYERKNELRKKVSALVEEAERPSPFVKGIEWTRMFLMILSIVLFAVLFAYFMTLSGDWIFMTALALFLFAGIVPLVKLTPSFFTKLDNMKQTDKPRYKFIQIAAAGLLFPVALLSYIFFKTQYMAQYDYINLTFIVIAWVLICLYVLPLFMKRRTDEAQKLYGRMLGFKRFIRLAKLPEMELILRDNPDYYYDVLPYCMIMGLSKKLDKQMRNLQVAVPDWAEGFDAKYFAEELFYTVKHAVVTRKKKDKNRNVYSLED